MGYQTVRSSEYDHLICSRSFYKWYRETLWGVFSRESILPALFNAGVPVTLGSDAPRSEQMDRYFVEARTILKEIGYTHITRYKNG